MFKIKEKVNDEDESEVFVTEDDWTPFANSVSLTLISPEQIRCKYFKSGVTSDQKSQSIASTSKSSPYESVIESKSQSTISQQSSDSRENAEKTSNLTTDSRTRKAVIGNTLLVNSNQSGNKLLKHLRIPYQMTDTISPAHYLMYDSCASIFLSLKYHVIYPNYIYDKLNELRNSYQLKVLLVLVDHIEYHSALKELTKLSIRTNCTLILAWSYEEAANHIENYRNFADKSADIITGKQSVNSDNKGETYQCLVDAITSVKSINKTDAVSLISMFDTFENIVNSDDDQLIVCPGMASLKAQRLRQFFNKPFIRSDD